MLLSYIYLISIIFIAIKTEKIRQKALAPALEDNWIIVEEDRAMDQIQEEIRRNII
jgi:hypothetical protein